MRENPNEQENSNQWADFFNFRLMVLPQCIKIIYLLGTIALIIGGICLIAKSRYVEGAWLGIGMIFAGPILLHVLLESCMVKFAILETLKQIRDQNQTQDK